MNFSSYLSAEKFILSRELFGMKLGLENVAQFLETIGKPQNNFKSIHIAGTNGKGSTAAMLASICSTQGYKTGLYTSPHLVEFRERIRVNGEMIPKPAVAAFIRKHHSVIRKRKLTFFEVVTALAFEYFAQSKVEIAIIETGLGGRLDATNVLVPHLTMTTDIDYDHTEILGTSIRKISIEKAGIIKSGRPHLVGILPELSQEVFSKQCRKLGSKLYELSRDDYSADTIKMKIDFDDGEMKMPGLRPPLYGAHQLRNTALVLKTISVLRQTGIKLTEDSVRKGIQRTTWPGRFQVLDNEHFPTIVLDVAHNIGGITAFVEAFRIRFPGRKATFISGFVKNKNHQKMFDILSKIASHFFLVPLKTKRTVKPDELIKSVKFASVSVDKASSAGSAFNRLTKKAAIDDIICVVGSHYLVGEFLKDYGDKWAKVPDKKQLTNRQKVRKNPPRALRIQS